MSVKPPKRPTLKEKVAVYEQLLHDIQFHREVTMNPQAVKILLDRVGSWSYSHRRGGGQLPEKDQNAMIDAVFWKLNEPV